LTTEERHRYFPAAETRYAPGGWPLNLKIPDFHGARYAVLG